MSSDSPTPIDELQQSLRSVQQLRHSSLTSVLLMSVGLIVIIGSFIYSITRLRPLEHQITDKQHELTELQINVEKLKEEREKIEQDIQEYKHKIESLKNDLKSITPLVKAQIKPQTSRQVNEKLILEKRELEDKRKEAIKLAYKLKGDQIKFTWGGKSPQEGFDSSGFIAYVLSKQNLARPPDLARHPEKYYSGLLAQVFRRKRYDNEIQIGDILFYEAGICMFNLGNNNCIGMLPEGVQIKEIDFGPKLLGYGRVDYQ